MAPTDAPPSAQHQPPFSFVRVGIIQKEILPPLPRQKWRTISYGQKFPINAKVTYNKNQHKNHKYVLNVLSPQVTKYAFKHFKFNYIKTDVF
jgi:hypothetical protein